MAYKLLWADDEIELLGAHIIFLKTKGYDVVQVTNGQDAIEACKNEPFDLILLDENMPGISGLETLGRIKEILPATPVVMVTKSEEEDIMEEAIGSKIADYLIKPVNPNQILLALKKNIHKKDIVTEKTNSAYQQNFGKLGMQISDCRTIEDWIDIYKKLVFWEFELESANSEMNELLKAQKNEANKMFSRFVKNNYMRWMSSDRSERPMMSHDIFRERIFPLLDKGEKVFLIVIDNFRYDQWRVLANEIATSFSIDEELYTGILPTATQYARNAIFAGLLPNQIKQMFPNLWVDEEEDEGKNLNEKALIETQIARYRRHDTFSYNKMINSSAADKYLDTINNLSGNDLNILVLNFIDMLSHARTESFMVRELASNEAAYRSITHSWIRHSAMTRLFRHLAESNYTVVITTDHGSVQVSDAVKVIGDKNTNTNLRYKLGKTLNYNPKEVFEVKEPSKAHLPAPNISTSYIFATGNDFFAYPNNYNYYVSYYKDTFQHGGISLEEMLIPIVTLRPKKN
ncbi:MAG: bifunctional response regulator/alkaline phosphatase family protein [Bacteroidaceae bacterium]|nr:bifunctional response regulator/alkaline phosphatase family protein [Bacteroidales bacterium]MBQ3187872.1 bifunctional response regulator/alkaline phosphatase family protein [Bacteroidaceae bacterium]MBQ3622603.1 bifunctional response regulator/alkaline phosphatase family protein [Bacteroidaceae bacterium]MBR7134229.1 bifunctional response regulator/alkaline phosphatase family protein [Bacteroidaceae bacterium]